MVYGSARGAERLTHPTDSSPVAQECGTIGKILLLTTANFLEDCRMNLSGNFFI